MFRKVVIMSFGVVLASCLNSQTHHSSSGVDDLAMLIENTFETPADNTKAIIRDRSVRVHSEALEGIWFYTQLNTGAEGKLYRQRLSHLTPSKDGTAILQKSYTFKSPELYENAWENPERLTAITSNDFEAYLNPGCVLTWKHAADDSWAGYVDPKTCVISSERRNKDIRIESELVLSKDIYRRTERGYEMDMTFLWGSKPGEYIDLYPVR